MRNLTLILITPLLLLTPLFAYDLTETDRVLIDSFQPKIQQMVEQETEKFDRILGKLDVMMPLLETDSRVYVVLEYLQGVMVSLIPEEPTVIEELWFADLLDELWSEFEEQVVEEEGVPEEEIIVDSEVEDDEDIVDVDPSYDYYAEEIWVYEDAETDDDIPTDIDYDDDLDEDFSLSDQWFEFDYEFEDDDEFDL